MTERSKKFFYLAAVASIIVFFSYFQFKNVHEVHSLPELTIVDYKDGSSAVVPVATQSAIHSKVTKAPPVVDDQAWTGDAHQQAEMALWFESHGWIDPSSSSLDDYKSYSEEMLKSLADRGDIKALELLAFNSRIPSESRQYFEKAAIYGSTHAFYGVINNLLGYTDLTNESSYENKKQLIVEVYAYKSVANKRGDYALAIDEQIESVSNKLKFESAKLDRTAIESRANEIYAQLEIDRKNLGLPAFDNTLSPTARAFYRSVGTLK